MVPLEGSVGVGVLIDAVMLGGLVVQSCLYYKNSKADMWVLSVLVSLILSLLLWHLGCMAAWLWESGQVDVGGASVAQYAYILFGVSNISGAAILFIERCFFSHRILRVSNNHVLTFAFFVLCVSSFTVALGAASIFFTNSTADMMHQLTENWIFPIVIISGLVCDLAVSIVTAFCIRSRILTEGRGDLGRGTRLFLWVVETGFVASLLDVAAVLVYWATRANLAWVGLFVSMPGVFANTLLASLNANEHLCADIQHRRTSELGGLIDERAKKAPIKIRISKQVDKCSEKSPV